MSKETNGETNKSYQMDDSCPKKIYNFVASWTGSKRRSIWVM